MEAHTEEEISAEHLAETEVIIGTVTEMDMTMKEGEDLVGMQGILIGTDLVAKGEKNLADMLRINITVIEIGKVVEG